ncbi:MAG: hypothetical protein F6J92_28950 [Symploca sp. SIO1A3]|nr:hypothetical protein [Symploca sp. SIO1A3]
MVSIKIIQNTIFKQSTADSGSLPASQLLNVPSGSTFEVTSYQIDNEHYYLHLLGKLGNYNSWYVYQGHAQLEGKYSLGYIATRKSDLPLRSNPGKQEPIKKNLSPGTIVEIDESQIVTKDGEDWCYGGEPGASEQERGWMGRQFIRLKKYARPGFVATNGSPLSVRFEPSNQSERLAELPNGTPIEVWGQAESGPGSSKGWLFGHATQGANQNQFGWMALDFLNNV